MWVIFPWVLALGVAALAKILENEEETPRTRSIEFCVGNCSALWLAEDGVLRVYAEQTSIDCYRMVVDCTAAPPSLIPGEVDGWPVRIRVSSEEPTEQKAARLFAQRAVAMGYELRPVTSPSGQISTLTPDLDSRTTTIFVEGPQISDRLLSEADRTASESGVSVSVDRTTPMGPFGHQAACMVRFSR